MYRRVWLLLNIKPNESALVRKLFTVQFFLGIATAFYFTSTLAMFLSTYKIEILPIVYVVSAVFLFAVNRVYAYLDEHLNSPRLLEIIILFSAAVIFVFWFLLTFFDFHSLKLIISASYLVIYMLVGYAFWGMASIMFNVRESKRLFSIVGSGDIPAKMLGYFSVTALIPIIGIYNLLWVSIVSFLIAFFLMKRYQNQGFITVNDPNEPHEHAEENANSITRNILKRFFHNKLILFIALLSVVSYIVFAFIDFTFLADIKVKFQKGEQMATFIAVFFAIGRVFSIGIKLLFSSRMIARIGLTNSLLVTPVLLLVINIIIICSTGLSLQTHLFVFGVMVMLTEILRSSLQEPVFFILFQPLKPHDRLRGHLAAKGYTMPIALIGVGVFLFFTMRRLHEIPISIVAQILIFFLGLWIIAIFLIKRAYLQTLMSSLKKGYFTGAELFLNDNSVTDILLKKVDSDNSIEVIQALNLLERSGYQDIKQLLLANLANEKTEIEAYVLSRIIDINLSEALPLLQKRMNEQSAETRHPNLIKAFYFFSQLTDDEIFRNVTALHVREKQPALIGLLRRKDAQFDAYVLAELERLSTDHHTINKLLVLDVIEEAPNSIFLNILKDLLLDNNSIVYKKTIETIGKIKEYDLFNEVIEIAAKHRAHAALQRSLLFYGDEVFSADYWDPEFVPETLLKTVISAAGKINGEHSTEFLMKLLRSHSHFADIIVNALWLKKCSAQPDHLVTLHEWVQQKIEANKLKIVVFNDLQNIKSLSLLQEAVGSELQSDLLLLLKAFAVMYDRQKVDRVIELLRMDMDSKIYNAIEVLELLLPGKYFSQINTLLELINDIKAHQVLLPKLQEHSGELIVQEILKDKKANFGEWTRSVACYMLLNLKGGKHAVQYLHTSVAKDEILFNETKNFVLSKLK